MELPSPPSCLPGCALPQTPRLLIQGNIAYTTVVDEAEKSPDTAVRLNPTLVSINHIYIISLRKWFMVYK